MPAFRSLWLSVGFLVLAASSAAAQVPSAPGDWPQWRGPQRDGISNDKGLLKEWPKEGPKVLWQVDHVGVGYSSLAVKGDRVYTQGDIDGVEHVLCLDAKDGHVVWQVQPEPVAKALGDRVANDFKQADKNGDGKIDEIEALARFNWDWNKFNKPTSADVAAIAATRAAALLKNLDKDGDGALTFAEAAGTLRDRFERIDAQDKTADAAALAEKRTAEYLKFDTDGDSRISRKEAKDTALDRQFGRIDQKDPATKKGDELLSAEEITASLKKDEAGRDGIISASELTEFYKNQRYTGDGELTLAELRGAIGGFREGQGDGPRGTPTVDGERIYAEGGFGDVTCIEAATGKTIWHLNLRTDLGGNGPGWGYSESPLIVENLVIVTPGGKAGTVAALDKMTGEKVWQSGEFKEGAHYSSPVLAEIHGVRQLVQFSNQSVFGVTLSEGKPLWRYTAPANGTANCCDPIIDGDLVFAASSYSTGGGLAKIMEAGSTQQAEEVYFDKQMTCHHGGIVKVGDYMYSAAAGKLICMEFKTGEKMWENRAAGKGAVCVADGMLYVLGEGHEVVLAEATPDAYRERGRFKIPQHGRPAWAHPVVTGGRLYIRDQQSLTVYDVRN